jgi:FolB domain-containing protein
MDHILINDLRVEAILGIYDWERVTPQPILISVSLSVDTFLAGELDDLSASVDYARLADVLQAHAQIARRLTVEALAADLARLCLEAPGVQKVRLRLEKPHAIDNARSVGVEIERSRTG